MYTHPNPKPVISRPKIKTPYVFGTTCTITPMIMKAMEIRNAHNLPTVLASVPPTKSWARPVDAQGTAAMVPERVASTL